MANPFPACLQRHVALKKEWSGLKFWVENSSVTKAGKSKTRKIKMRTFSTAANEGHFSREDV